ncbi:MAG TPA: VOC family protein [Candidatus Acidoferrales bacterium]|nr:VOC family protein [Candidatus Acidoferrales bacterium]
MHGQLVAGGGSFASGDGDIDLTYNSGRNSVSANVDGFEADRYLDPPVLGNYTNSGSSANISASYEREVSDRSRIRITLAHDTADFLVPNIRAALPLTGKLLQQFDGVLQTFVNRAPEGIGSDLPVISAVMTGEIGAHIAFAEAALLGDAGSDSPPKLEHRMLRCYGRMIFAQAETRGAKASAAFDIANRPEGEIMPNPFCHVELHSNDLEKSKEFYTKLFDWKLEDMPDGNHSYTIIRVGEGTGGGMMKAPMPGTPSAWLAYVCVDDIVASTAKAKSLGARMLLDVTEAAGYGRFSVFTDPQGAHFAMFQATPRK